MLIEWQARDAHEHDIVIDEAAQRAREVKAACVGKRELGQHDIGLTLRCAIEAGTRVARRLDDPAAPHELTGKRIALVRVVVDHEDAARDAHQLSPPSRYHAAMHANAAFAASMSFSWPPGRVATKSSNAPSCCQRAAATPSYADR